MQWRWLGSFSKWCHKLLQCFTSRHNFANHMEKEKANHIMEKVIMVAMVTNIMSSIIIKVRLASNNCIILLTLKLVINDKYVLDQICSRCLQTIVLLGIFTRVFGKTSLLISDSQYLSKSAKITTNTETAKLSIFVVWYIYTRTTAAAVVKLFSTVFSSGNLFMQTTCASPIVGKYSKGRGVLCIPYRFWIQLRTKLLRRCKKVSK